jgi:hypothetical protein
MAAMSVDQQRALALARARRRRAEATASAPQVSRTEAILSGFAEGLRPVHKLLGGEAFQSDAMERLSQRTQQIAAQAQQSRPNYFTGGQIAGEVATTAPLVALGGGIVSTAGRGLARVAPRIGAAVERVAPRIGAAVERVAPRIGAAVERVGTAVRTGGIGSGRTAEQTAAMTKVARAKLLAERTAGGAIAGGAGAALVGQDAETGAMFGAGLPVIGSVLRSIGGAVPDLVKIPTLNAARIIRETLGNNVEAAKAALRDLSPNDRRIAEQVMREAGVENDAFYGLGKIAQERFKQGERPIRETLESQAAAREARLAAAGGGPEATTIRATAEAGRRDVSDVTGPLRETALGNVKDTNLAVSSAEQLAAQTRAAANDMTASGFVPRMRGLEGRSTEQINLMGQRPDVFPEDGLLARTTEIAGSAGSRADQALATQLRLRDTARDMEDYVADLAAQGREPLLAAPLANTLRQQASAEGVRTSSARRALLKLAKEIEDGADQNGMLSPYDLYTLRKEASDIVEKYVASSAQPSTGSKKRAAGLVIGFKNSVDEALGPEFRDYLTQHQLGMQKVNMQELGGEAARLAKESPNEFIALMRGDRPKIVEGVLGKGTGQYDIGGMALADPNRYQALTQSANELSTLNRMAELRSAGAGRAGDIISNAQPNIVQRGVARALLSPFPTVRIATEGVLGAERAAVSPFTQRNIAEAYASGPNMLALLNQYPASMTADELISRLPAGARNAIAQALNRGFGER